MYIISDESSRVFSDMLCQDCGKVKPARYVRVTGQFKEDRGNYVLCFDCFEPRVFWKDEREIVFQTPVSLFYKRPRITSSEYTGERA